VLFMAQVVDHLLDFSCLSTPEGGLHEFIELFVDFCVVIHCDHHLFQKFPEFIAHRGRKGQLLHGEKHRNIFGIIRHAVLEGKDFQKVVPVYRCENCLGKVAADLVLDLVSFVLSLFDLFHEPFKVFLVLFFQGTVEIRDQGNTIHDLPHMVLERSERRLGK